MRSDEFCIFRFSLLFLYQEGVMFVFEHVADGVVEVLELVRAGVFGVLDVDRVGDGEGAEIEVG